MSTSCGLVHKFQVGTKHLWRRIKSTWDIQTTTSGTVTSRVEGLLAQFLFFQPQVLPIGSMYGILFYLHLVGFCWILCKSMYLTLILWVSQLLLFVEDWQLDPFRGVWFLNPMPHATEIGISQTLTIDSHRTWKKPWKHIGSMYGYFWKQPPPPYDQSKKNTTIHHNQPRSCSTSKWLIRSRRLSLVDIVIKVVNVHPFLGSSNVVPAEE